MHISFDLGKNSSPSPSPLRIAIAGDFGPDTETSQPVLIDKDNFREVMHRYAGELLFEVPNRLASHPKQLRVDLQISDLTSLTPAGLTEQIPELTRALELRDQLRALAGGTLSHTDFEAGLDAFQGLDAFAEVLRLYQQARQSGTPEPAGSPAPAPTASETQTGTAGDDAIDRIMDMVGGQDDRKSTAAISQLEQVISEIGAGSTRPAACPEYNNAVAAAEHLIAGQFDEILHHPLFQECEALWRGLKFLVDRTDFREGIQIDLLTIQREQFGEDVRKHIHEYELTGHPELPLGLLVLPFAIENQSSDLEQLQILGEAAGELQVPVLISASPAFFQLDTGAEAATMPYPGSLLSRPEYAKWNALRDKEASRWLTLCFNRFLLRAPYTPEQRNTSGLSEGIHHHNEHLWGEPAWLLASLVTASFARTRWPTEITGTDDGQVEDLPLYRAEKPGEQELQIPLEALLSGQLAEDLADAGFTPFICRPNRDSAYALWAPVLHRPEVYGDEATTAASRAMSHLPYQLLASRISDAITSNLPRLRASAASADELGMAIGTLVRQLVANTGTGANVSVDVQQDQDKTGTSQVDLRIHTGKQLLNGADVQLSFRV